MGLVERGGPCWFCKRLDADLEFSLEFDTNVHRQCIVKALEKDPHDSEARLMAREFGIIVEVQADELERLRKRVAELEAGLGWALREGGWRLWYHRRTEPPPVIEVPTRVGEVARIRPMEEVV